MGKTSNKESDKKDGTTDVLVKGGRTSIESKTITQGRGGGRNCFKLWKKKKPKSPPTSGGGTKGKWAVGSHLCVGGGVVMRERAPKKRHRATWPRSKHGRRLIRGRKAAMGGGEKIPKEDTRNGKFLRTEKPKERTRRTAPNRGRKKNYVSRPNKGRGVRERKRQSGRRNTGRLNRELVLPSTQKKKKNEGGSNKGKRGGVCKKQRSSTGGFSGRSKTLISREKKSSKLHRWEAHIGRGGKKGGGRGMPLRGLTGEPEKGGDLAGKGGLKKGHLGGTKEPDQRYQ